MFSSSVTKKLIIVASALSIAACSSAPRAPQYSVDAQVVKVDYAPEICRYKDSGGSKIGGAVLGTVIGGVAGNQFGSGKGRAAMTVIGALTGFTVGISMAGDDKSNKMVCKDDGYVAVLSYFHPVTKMHIVEERAFKKRPRRKLVNIII